MKKLIAYITDESYAALKSGDIVLKNGFRSRKGFFYPEQPIFCDISELGLTSKQAIDVLCLSIVGCTLVKYIAPKVERFGREKLVPAIRNKLDKALQDYMVDTETDQGECYVESKSETDNIIPFSKKNKIA